MDALAVLRDLEDGSWVGTYLPRCHRRHRRHRRDVAPLAPRLGLLGEDIRQLWDGNTLAASSGARVHVVQAAEHRPRTDRAAGARSRADLWQRRLQAQRPVRAVPVVVADELRQHRAEVPLAEHDEVVETLSTEGVLLRYIVTGRGSLTSCPAMAVPRWRRDCRGHDVADHPGVTM